MLCGIAPIPATSGLIDNRFRLNYAGDRHANDAIWRIVITRLGQHDPRTVGAVGVCELLGWEPRSAGEFACPVEAIEAGSEVAILQDACQCDQAFEERCLPQAAEVDRIETCVANQLLGDVASFRISGEHCSGRHRLGIDCVVQDREVRVGRFRGRPPGEGLHLRCDGRETRGTITEFVGRVDRDLTV